MNYRSTVFELELPEPNTLNISSIYFMARKDGLCSITLFFNDDEARDVMRAYALVHPSIKPITLNSELAFRMSTDEFVSLFGNLKLKPLSEAQKNYKDRTDFYQELLKKYS